MVECSKCSANFKNKASLRSHVYNYHKGRPSKRISPYPKKMYECPCVSDSDSTMDSTDDEPQTEKPRWVKLSEDDKACIRKHNLHFIERNRSPHSSDEEHPSKRSKRIPIKYSDIYNYNKNPRKNRMRLKVPDKLYKLYKQLYIKPAINFLG